MDDDPWRNPLWVLAAAIFVVAAGWAARGLVLALGTALQLIVAGAIGGTVVVAWGAAAANITVLAGTTSVVAITTVVTLKAFNVVKKEPFPLIVAVGSAAQDLVADLIDEYSANNRAGGPYL